MMALIGMTIDRKTSIRMMKLEPSTKAKMIGVNISTISKKSAASAVTPPT